MPQIQLDIHTHTIASGHASTATISDMAKAAARNGLSILGISDHGPATCLGGKPSYFRSLAYAEKKRQGVTMLYGAEVNIMDQNGTLDLPDTILKNLDFCIASMHRPAIKPGTEAENTNTYIEAMKHPHVHIIGHCDDTHFPVDYPSLVKAAILHHVILEINNSSLRPDGYRGDTRFHNLMILNLCKHYNHPVLLSSDSHGTAHVGDLSYALSLAKRADMPEELILNYHPEKLTGFLCK